MQTLGYAIYGERPEHNDVIFEIGRVRQQFRKIERDFNVMDVNVQGKDKTDAITDAVSINWPEFLVFSISLSKKTDQDFNALIEKCLERVDRANPLLSKEKLREAYNLHLKKDRIFKKK